MRCPKCGRPAVEPGGCASHAELPPGTILAGRYLVVRVLGRGAASTVYQALDRMLDERVAIKVLDAVGAAAPSAAARLRSEIKLARRVTHANVCRIHDYGEDGPHRFICMELIEGRNLRDVLAERGRLLPAEACAVGAQAAAALDAIHRRGIVHRDVKPANLIQDATGRVYVTDFGVATGGGPGTAGLIAGYVAGTPEYMSPEQAQGLRLDARSDLYALGVVLFEMLTGEVPFRGASTSETLLRHVQEAVPVEALAPVPASRELRELVERLLAKHRDDRPGTAAVVAQALSALTLTERGVPSLPPRTAASVAAEPAPGTVAVPPAAVPDKAVAVSQTVTLPRWPQWSARWGRTAAALFAVVVALFAVKPRPEVGRVAERTPSVAPADRRGDEQLAAAIASAPPAGRPAAAVSRAVTAPRRTQGTAPSPPAIAVGAPLPEPRLPGRRVGSLDAPISVSAKSADEPPVVAGEPAPTVGHLQIGVVPWAEVSVDGVRVGTTPLAPVPLTAGTYTARLEHPDFKPLVRKVTIRPGQTTPLRFDLNQDAIRNR
jgi:serine/threonine-protein kinase